MKTLTTYAFTSDELDKKHPEILKLATVKDDEDVLSTVMSRIYETITNWAKVSSLVSDDDDFAIEVGISKRPVDTVKFAMKFEAVKPFTDTPFYFVFSDAQATEDSPNPFVEDLFDNAEPFVSNVEVGGDEIQILNEEDARGHDIAVMFLHHLIPSDIKDLIESKTGDDINKLLSTRDSLTKEEFIGKMSDLVDRIRDDCAEEFMKEEDDE